MDVMWSRDFLSFFEGNLCFYSSRVFFGLNSKSIRREWGKKWREFHYTRYVSNLKLMNFIPSQMTSSVDAAAGNFIVRNAMSRRGGGWRIDETRAKSWCELFGRMKLSRSFFLAKGFPSDWSASQTHASTLYHGKYIHIAGEGNWKFMTWKTNSKWLLFVCHRRKLFFYKRSVNFGRFVLRFWKHQNKYNNLRLFFTKWVGNGKLLNQYGAICQDRNRTTCTLSYQVRTSSNINETIKLKGSFGQRASEKLFNNNLVAESFCEIFLPVSLGLG